MSYETVVTLFVDRLPADYPDISSIKSAFALALTTSTDYELTWKQILSNTKKSDEKCELTRDQLLALYCHPDRVFARYGTDSFFKDLQHEGLVQIQKFLKALEHRLAFELLGFNLSDVDKVNTIMKPLIELEKWRWQNLSTKNDLQELTFDNVHREFHDDHIITVHSNDVEEFLIGAENGKNTEDQQSNSENDEAQQSNSEDVNTATSNQPESSTTENVKVATLGQTEPPTRVAYTTVESPLVASAIKMTDVDSIAFDKIIEDLTNFAFDKKDNSPPIIENVDKTDESGNKQRKWNWMNLSLQAGYVISKWTPFVPNVLIDIERYARADDLSVNRYYTLVSNICTMMQKILPVSAGHITYEDWIAYFQANPNYKLTYETTTRQPVVSLIPREAVNAQFAPKSDVDQSS